ncbi:hypothetical protein ABPG72_021572 [Tetrahymena utriculariae]
MDLQKSQNLSSIFFRLLKYDDFFGIRDSFEISMQAIKNKRKIIIQFFKVSIFNTENQTKSIEFNLEKCIYTGILNIVGSYICPIQVQVGSPSQQLTLSFAINRVTPQELLQSGTSFLLSQECKPNIKCISFIKHKNYGTTFNPRLSNSLNRTKIQYSNKANATLLIINGEYQSDLFQISEKVEEKIKVPFILIDSMWSFNGGFFGILNFERNNKDHLILQGYLQNQFKSPKFALTTENKVGKLIYDKIPEFWDQAIEIPTKSSDLWVKYQKIWILFFKIYEKDLKVSGLLLGDKDVLPLAHFQSIEFTLFPYTQIPKGLANYFLKTYPNLLYKIENIVHIQDCEQCNCLEKLDLPDLKIYTEKVMIKLTPRQYFHQDTSTKLNCSFEISVNKIMLSRQFYQDYPTIFNTQNGTIAIQNFCSTQQICDKELQCSDQSDQTCQLQKSQFNICISSRCVGVSNQLNKDMIDCFFKTCKPYMPFEQNIFYYISCLKKEQDQGKSSEQPKINDKQISELMKCDKILKDKCQDYSSDCPTKLKELQSCGEAVCNLHNNLQVSKIRKCMSKQNVNQKIFKTAEAEIFPKQTHKNQKNHISHKNNSLNSK